jgi:hypothetical protein
VVSASSVPGELQQDVTMNPLVDLKHLRFVRVLQHKPDPVAP